jgi:hypothetical protein
MLFGRIPEGVRANTRTGERTPPLPERLLIQPRRLQASSLRAPTTSEGVRESRRRQEQTPPLPERALIRQRLLQVSFSHAPTAQVEVLRRAPERRPLRLQFERPEELVWHRGHRPPTFVTENEPHQSRSEPFQGPPVRSLPGQEAASVVAPAVERAAAQVTKLDPGLLDRLTNDVIRRVEQRIRIERERRGL